MQGKGSPEGHSQKFVKCIRFSMLPIGRIVYETHTLLAFGLTCKFLFKLCCCCGNQLSQVLIQHLDYIGSLQRCAVQQHLSDIKLPKLFVDALFYCKIDNSSSKVSMNNFGNLMLNFGKFVTTALNHTKCLNHVLRIQICNCLLACGNIYYYTEAMLLGHSGHISSNTITLKAYPQKHKDMCNKLQHTQTHNFTFSTYYFPSLCLF